MSRVHLQRSEAVVLRRHDYGEADRILTLFTRERGKLHAIAKGVRRIASRKSGHLELFTRCRLLLARGRNLEVVTQAETVDAYGPLREDLVRTAYAYHLAELTDRLTADENPSPGVFDLLTAMLGALTVAEEPSLVARYFEVRLLGLAGYRPQLFHCALCQQLLAEEGNAFSPSGGGALCPDCAGRPGDALHLDGAAFRVLRFLQTRDWSDAGALRLSPATRGALERLTGAYIEQILERDLSSMGFLRSLRSAAASLGLAAAPDTAPADRPVAAEPA
ncbi:MAG TPA: DNA repair protein RecO [Anaerolineae bacterium]|nr:DNA repair protein RecO [Anaerolineae bacterium]HRA19198.1 DNA repair protein RecO [Anaerolineae bacterium]